ncbi:hypothetical protein RSOLAG1IB_01349 [Rhizoctonia solani AG-1 IB]|uniref:Alpha/beta hydrolase family domain-containing protein n=1 Tax=Thanatephorus cucumeris (strain AG1-IB / isolate 7/3/14) TaxID=1108050 RepID=A0A0B7FEH1_THACB|nr:hypothetical protein RSOLAG1IB_01349 [Rhizoctonia solani AG-1 IB]
MDSLPAVLCPNNDRFIDTWMVAGLSLGAHAAWLSMDRDPRLSVCIPIIGSPDFLEIATARNDLTGLPLVSSYMTSATRNHILKNDPVLCRRSSLRPDPFVNKHILALAGAQDRMVPFVGTRQFLDRINVGPFGTKRLIIQQGVGHQCTREMVVEMAEFVWSVALRYPHMYPYPVMIIGNNMSNTTPTQRNTLCSYQKVEVVFGGYSYTEGHGKTTKVDHTTRRYRAKQ